MSLIFEIVRHDLKIHIFIVHHHSLVGIAISLFILFIECHILSTIIWKITYLILKIETTWEINIQSIKIILKERARYIIKNPNIWEIRPNMYWVYGMLGIVLKTLYFIFIKNSNTEFQVLLHC